MKKAIVITNLAMRFYKHDGWTKEVLTEYLKKGSLRYFDDPGAEYWILNAYSNLDVVKLVRDGHVGDLLGRNEWGDDIHHTDLEILESRNW